MEVQGGLSDSSENTQAERCWALGFVYIEITHPCCGTAHGLEEARSLHTCLQKAGAVALALWPVDLPPPPHASAFLSVKWGIASKCFRGSPAKLLRQGLPPVSVSTSWGMGWVELLSDSKTQLLSWPCPWPQSHKLWKYPLSPPPPFPQPPVSSLGSFPLPTSPFQSGGRGGHFVELG